MSYKYFAFISYSHKDKKWGEKIHRALLRYRFPSIVRKSASRELPNKIQPIFLDSDNLKSGHVWENIKPALDQSRKLIVICSPHSAQPNADGKQWVNEEVSYFVSQGRAEDIIPIMVSGDLQTSRCPALLEQSDILVHDVRRLGTIHTVSNIVAGLVGLDPDELWRREARRIRNRNIRNTILAILGLCGLAALSLSWFNSVKARERYRKESIKASKEIASHIVSRSSNGTLEKRRDLILSNLSELDKITAPEIKAATMFQLGMGLAEVSAFDDAQELVAEAKQQFVALSDVAGASQCDDLQESIGIIRDSISDRSNAAFNVQHTPITELGTNLCVATAEYYLSKANYTNALIVVGHTIPVNAVGSAANGLVKNKKAWRIAAESYDRLNDFSRSLACCSEAMRIDDQDETIKVSDENAIISLCCGKAFCRMGDIDLGVQNLISAIRMFKQSNVVFNDRYVEACLEYAEYGLDSHRNDVTTILYELVDAKENGIEISNVSIAKTWTLLVKANKGDIRDYEKAKAFLQSSGMTDSLLMVDVNLDRIATLIEEKALEYATSILEETFRTLLKTCQFKSIRMAKACMLQGRLLSRNGDYMRAHIYLRYANKLFDENTEKGLSVLRRDCSRELARCYLSLGDYDRAVKFDKEFKDKESSDKKMPLVEYNRKEFHEAFIRISSKINDVDNNKICLQEDEFKSLSKECERWICVLLANSSKLISEDSDNYIGCLSGLYLSLSRIETRLNHLLFGCITMEIATEGTSRIVSLVVDGMQMQKDYKALQNSIVLNLWTNTALSFGANVDEVEGMLSVSKNIYRDLSDYYTSISKSSTYFTLANFDEQEEKYGEAIEHYELAIAELITNSGGTNDIQIADIYVREGGCHEKLSKIDAAMTCYEKAMNIFKRMSGNNKGEKTAYEKAVLCAIKISNVAKDKEERKRQLDYASTIIKNHLDANSLLVADYYLAASKLMESQKDYIGASSNLVAQIKILEANHIRPQQLEERYYSLGLYQSLLKDYKNALETFEKCEKLSNDFPASNAHWAEILSHKAWSLQCLGRFQLAIEQQLKAIDLLMPQSSDTEDELAKAYTSLAAMYLASKRVAESISSNQNALSVIKHSSCINTNRLEGCLYRLGCAYFGAGHFKDAIDIFNEHRSLLENGGLQANLQENYLSGGELLSIALASLGEFSNAKENLEGYIVFCRSRKLTNITNKFEWDQKYIASLAEGGQSVICVSDIKGDSLASKHNIQTNDILLAIGNWRFDDPANTWGNFIRNCEKAMRSAQSGEYDMWIGRWVGKWCVIKVHFTRGTNGISWRPGHHDKALLDARDCKELQVLLNAQINQSKKGD